MWIRNQMLVSTCVVILSVYLRRRVLCRPMCPGQYYCSPNLRPTQFIAVVVSAG